jgi:hypothetical protein
MRWVLTSGSVEFVKRLQNILGYRPDGDALGQIHPLNRAGRINQELGRPGNVSPFQPAVGMEKIIAANHFCLGIGQNGKAKAQFLAKPPTCFRRVDADRGDAQPALLKIGQSLLKTPQLGVAKRSPKPAIKNQ